MYSVNGVPLDNDTLNWRFRAPSKPLSELSRIRTALRTPGRDGIRPGMPASTDALTLTMVVETPRSNFETLLMLFAQDGYLTLTSNPNRRVAFELVSNDNAGFGDADALVDVAFLIRLPRPAWRDTTESTSSAVSTSSTPTVASVFSGLSAPVQDAIVRIRGAVSGTALRVTDAAGSWFAYPFSIPTGNYLRFEADTGMAFLTATNVWTGGTDVSGSIDFGGPRSVFEITPKWTSTPATRAGELTVTHGGTAVGSQIEVRGRGAYLA